MADDGLGFSVNLPDFKAQMQGLRDDMQKKIVASAANAAAQVFKKAMIRAAPELQRPDRRKKNPRVAGTLRRAIYAYRSRSPDTGVVTYKVSFRKGVKEQTHKTGNRDAFYGRFLELGWTPRGRGKRLKGGARSKRLQRALNRAAGARHIEQYKFIEPAFESAKDAALAAFNARIAKRIERANQFVGPQRTRGPSVTSAADAAAQRFVGPLPR